MLKKRIFWFVSSFCAIYASGLGNAYAVDTDWHGQFRINSYYQDASKDDVFGRGDDIQASRLRFRPTLDFDWDNGVKAHIQLNIGHINSNIGNARLDNDGNPAVALRHGYISAPIPDHEDFTLVAGLVPMSDKFGDTLFSADWDYNPLTYMLLGNIGGVELRIAHGNLVEGLESSHPADDLDQWFFDADTKTGFGASFYAVNDNTKPTSSVTGASLTNEYYAGVRYNGKFSSADFNAFAIYNWGERKVPPSGVNPTERKNSGFAVKAEVKVPVSKAKVGLLGIYASGDKDFNDATKDSASSFITPMSIAGTTGYWGYTGKLNVQGPTDTGVDTSFVNIDGGGYATSNTNLGNGLVTIQANAAIPITDKLEGYAAAGWFSHTDAAAGFKKYIGTDLYAQLKYLFWESLSLEAGVDYAMLGKGHPASVALGTANQSTRNEILVFSRLQLEF